MTKSEIFKLLVSYKSFIEIVGESLISSFSLAFVVSLLLVFFFQVGIVYSLLVFIFIFLIFSIIFLKFSFEDKKNQALLYKTAHIEGDLNEIKHYISLSKKFSSPINDRKNEILKKQSFRLYYYTESEIEDIYLDLIEKHALTNYSEELVEGADLDGAISPGLGRIGSRIQSKKRVIRDYKSRIKFLHSIKKVIESGDVVFGLELVDGDTTSVYSFMEKVESLKDDYGFEISGEKVDDHIKTLNQKAFSSSLESLETSLGSTVVVKGEFSISILENESIDQYELSMVHPISGIFSEETIIIRSLLERENLDKKYLTYIDNGTMKSLSSYIWGEIIQSIDLKKNKYILEIRPIAVFN